MSNTDVTEMVLQWSQPSCIVISVLEMVENEIILFQLARLEIKENVFNLQDKVVKSVTFDLPITKNGLEPGSPKGLTVEVPIEQKQTKEFGSLPIIGKAQRSVYSYMLTMKM
jgi:hypothetical protein